MTSLGILVAGVAHEINNPATTLMLNAPNLKKAFQAFIPVLDRHFAKAPNENVCNMSYPDLRQRIELMLSAVQDSSVRIKAIITELKDFSRPSSDLGEKQEIDVNQLVEKSVDLTHAVLKKITPNLWVHYHGDLPRVMGDFQKLQQVVINLLVNAGQALENSDQTICVSTYINEARSFVGIAVEDTGPGVSEADLKKMKDPFFTTRRDEGEPAWGCPFQKRLSMTIRGFWNLNPSRARG